MLPAGHEGRTRRGGKTERGAAWKRSHVVQTVKRLEAEGRVSGVLTGPTFVRGVELLGPQKGKASLWANPSRNRMLTGKPVRELACSVQFKSLKTCAWSRRLIARRTARRRRSNGNNAFVAKVRWSRTLRPKPKAPAVPPRAEPIALPDWTRIGDAGSGLSVGVPFD